MENFRSRFHFRKFFKRLMLLVLLHFVIISISLNTYAATITSTATGGAWNLTSTWIGGVVPGNADIVIIATTTGNSVITPTGVNYIIRALRVNSSAILTLRSAFSITDTTSIKGTINFGSPTQITFNFGSTGGKDVFLWSGSVWDESNGGTNTTFISINLLR